MKRPLHSLDHNGDRGHEPNLRALSGFSDFVRIGS
jgi:hypothetical protein